MSCTTFLLAQEPRDTFFLAKKRGLLGKLGKSITSTPSTEPVKVVNPFLQYKGKIIRHIDFLPLGFDRNINDTTQIKNNFGTRVANKLHQNTTKKTLQNNLFFEEGETLYPLLLADNERHLREIAFIRDARIIVDTILNNKDSVDIIIITKDVFSIGGNIDVSNAERAEVEVRDENISGRGMKITLSGLYDKQRLPVYGTGIEMKLRNLKGTFVDFTSGFKNFKNAFTSNRNEEMEFYIRGEKPLVSAYMPSTGALEIAYNKTQNNYSYSDSVYKKDYQYAYLNIDAWYAYNFGTKGRWSRNREKQVRSFFATRFFYQKFYQIPVAFVNTVDYRYVNARGILSSINVFKQNFYKTNFVYGFGVYEDIPEGFNLSITAGWSDKLKRIRPYGGIDVALTRYSDKGIYTSYTFRMGGNFYKKRFEDCELLLSADHFTKLRQLSAKWFNRNFLNVTFSAQVNPYLNAPLFLRSSFGLPYINNGQATGDFRIATRGESVLYGTTKFLGFRFAPFLFTDLCLLKPVKQNLYKMDLFSAFGAGIRSRNENLVFGTMELRGFYFPRKSEGLKNWKVEFTTGLRFRFFSQFIHRPDFLIAN